MTEIKNKRKLDLICLGRAGIDFNTCDITSIEKTVTFKKTVGGSPANIAAGAAKLGLRTGFIGRVADNGFGRFIISCFESWHIDTSGTLFDTCGGVNGLAVTEIITPTDCGSILYRDNASDLNLSPEDIKEEYIASAACLLISGTALSKSPSREAVFLAAEYARRNQTLVALDIDYRPFSWKSQQETAIYLNLFCERCDIIIGNREEFDILDCLTLPFDENQAGSAVQASALPASESEHSWTAKSNTDRRMDERSAERWLQTGCTHVVMKRGSEGATCFSKDGNVEKMGVYPAEMKKSFGAGDAFAAGFLYGILMESSAQQGLRYGAAAASIVVSRLDCSESMPVKEEVDQLIESYPHLCC